VVYVIIFTALFLCGTPQPMAASAYRAYAEQVTQQPPQGVSIRPDLEAVLDGLAQQARAGKKRPLVVSAVFKTAVRAQAIDMVLGDFVGHTSLKGYSFRARFAAFTEDPDQFPARGENAARERSRGPAGEAKAKKLFQQWLDSGGHRRNLLNRSYNRMSTGVVQKGDHLYAVQMFWTEPEEQ
ncbi:MAG: CAP domain-containing protein, partial [Aestuariivirgaceae bacterium]